MKKQIQAFTLVELIVVITILAILWTIAFISLQWYSRSTRDSVRISDLSNINKMIWVKIASTWKVPAPEDYIEITASWTVLNYQWKAWEKVLDILWVFNWWIDPLDNSYYTYSTNSNLTKYQLLWFLEWDSLSSNLNMLETTNAETDLSTRTIETRWDELWIILDATTNEPVTETVDVLNTTDTYKTVFTKTDSVEWTWWVLFSNIYNRNEYLLKNKDLAELDESLVLYFDMETTTMSWSQVVLKDFSLYWNNWSCMNSWSVVDCWSSEWPQFITWLNWNAMDFDGVDDYIQVLNHSSLNIDKNITVFALFKNTHVQRSTILSKNNNVDWYRMITETPQYNKYSWWVETWNILKYNWVILDDNDYFNVVWTYDNNINKLYFNWDLVNSIQASNNLWIYSWNLNLWKHYNNSMFLKWLIDEIRIYNRVLSDEEIETLYNATK